MKTKKVFFWACDYSSNTGEGRLGRLYIKKFTKKFKIKPIRINPLNKKLFNYKYISPFIGVLIVWYYFLKKKKIIYLNYLPYWNFLLFLLLPPSTEIGPITGGASYSKKSKDYYFRKLIFPILYLLSGMILRLRFNNLIFSTDLLKKRLSNKLIKKSKFNFIFHEINELKKVKNKDINFLFYFRKHKNKEYSFPFKFVNKLLLNNYSVNIIGDKMNLKKVKNYGFLTHDKVIKLLNRTRYTVVSNENIFSFFTIDAINNDVKLLVDFKMYNSIKHYKKKFIKFNFNTNNLEKLKIKKCQ